MTHAALSETCIRRPGVPPSQCPGELDLTDSRVDSAQEGEGAVGEILAVDLYRCRRCRQTIVVRHAADGWFLSNEYELEPQHADAALVAPGVNGVATTALA